MIRTMEVIGRHPHWGRTMALMLAVITGIAVAAWVQRTDQQERQQLLEIAAQRHAIEARALTLDGNLIGAISMLGLVEPAIKQESTGNAAPNTPEVKALLASVARTYHAQAVFLVNHNGLVSSSWNADGKSSTGIQVQFRPYFRMAMRGSENVYAAVSLSRDERTLYFTAPIYAGQLQNGAPIGAVVASTGMEKINQLMTVKGQTVLLLSPQGVVFSGNRPEWLGMLSGALTAAKVDQIRATRQFGKLFDNTAPRSLPFAAGTGIRLVNGTRQAMASATVNWNDPSGPWQLVLMEDLQHSVPPGPAMRAGLLAGLVTLLVCLLLLRVRRSQLAQREAVCQLELIARTQAALAERKMQLAQVALRLQQTGAEGETAAAFLSECQRLFGALQGAVYVVDQGKLRLAGAYACAAPPPTLELGEGLLGQCAREQQARLIDTATGDSPWHIHSGLGASPPAALLLAPMLLQSRLLGVIELALPQRPASAVLDEYMAAVELLAINLGFARRAAADPLAA